MNNETYLDFCFIRQKKENFSEEIHAILSKLFADVKLHWFLEEKVEQGVEMVIAQVKGMSKWCSEEEAIEFIESQAEPVFWDYLQGYQMYIYPVNKRGCANCGTH